MSKYRLTGSGNSDERIRDTMAEISQRAAAVPPGACPLTVELALLQMAEYQTCGKCVPCRDGLPQLEKLLRLIVKCRGDESMKVISVRENVRTGSVRRFHVRSSARLMWIFRDILH